MKRYKLIRKYPGSPEIGDIVKRDQILKTTYVLEKNAYKTFYFMDVENHPEFWEKIIEKDYEILSFIRNNKTLSNASGGIKVKNSDGYFVWDLTSSITEESDLLNNTGFDIHSVKRLSDGEVFTVGDKIKQWGTGSFLFIERIYYNKHNQLSYKLKGTQAPLIFVFDEKTVKLKEPLFTTEDGIDIFEGNTYYAVHKTGMGLHEVKTHQKFKNIIYYKTNDWLTFSTKEKAEEYILMNKPCLSVKDFKKLWLNSCYSDELLNKVKELVKSKL